MELKKKKVLLVDDEQAILDLLEEVLKKEGFQHVLKTSTGEAAIELCRTEQPDLIVLDVMLPGIDGIETCRRIREFSYCSILFLSSKDDDIDKILGLSIGGDDYVTKPFSPKEVVFRLKAQLRRKRYEEQDHQAKETIKIGNIHINIESQRVYKNEKEIVLTAREYGLLTYFAQNPDKIISKDRLYEQVWGENSFGSENTLMVHIRHLREKLEDDPSAPKIIVTVKGLGYKLVKSYA